MIGNRGWDVSLTRFLALIKSAYRSCSRAVREILYGMTVHELDLEVKKAQAHLNNVFMLVVFGDLVGLPLLPPYFSLRLLPYIIPHIETWKRSLLRERDLSDRAAMDL